MGSLKCSQSRIVMPSWAFLTSCRLNMQQASNMPSLTPRRHWTKAGLVLAVSAFPSHHDATTLLAKQQQSWWDNRTAMANTWKPPWVTQWQKLSHWSGFWALFSSLFKKQQRRLAWHDRIQELIHQISVNRPVSQSNLVVQHALGSFDLSVAGAFI